MLHTVNLHIDFFPFKGLNQRKNNSQSLFTVLEDVAQVRSKGVHEKKIEIDIKDLFF